MGMDESSAKNFDSGAINQTHASGECCACGAVYSHRFVEDVNQKAQEAFSHARQYLIQHQDSQLSPYAAYEKAVSLLQQATPKLLNGALSRS